MTPRKKQVQALGGTVVVGDQASGERFAEIESGRCRWQQGLVAGYLQRLPERGEEPNEGRANGIGA
jgi:hypothetical protein